GDRLQGGVVADRRAIERQCRLGTRRDRDEQQGGRSRRCDDIPHVCFLSRLTASNQRQGQYAGEKVDGYDNRWSHLGVQYGRLDSRHSRPRSCRPLLEHDISLNDGFDHLCGVFGPKLEGRMEFPNGRWRRLRVANREDPWILLKHEIKSLRLPPENTDHPTAATVAMSRPVTVTEHDKVGRPLSIDSRSAPGTTARKIKRAANEAWACCRRECPVNVLVVEDVLRHIARILIRLDGRHVRH